MNKITKMIIGIIIAILIVIMAIWGVSSTRDDSPKTDKSANEFEIKFYDEQQEGNKKINTILEKTEADYEYNIYVYDGSANIIINGNEKSLRNALLENEVTMDAIIEKANKDFPDAISYDDGGSMEYHYDNYTIIKIKKLNGNRDVYIGTKNMTLNDLPID